MKQEELSYKRRKQMAESLKKLMVHKNLQKITIQEIADDCGISRYTFYYHFKDIYDLLVWTFQDEALSLIQKSDNCLTWQDGFQLFLRSLRENKAVWQCAMNSLGQDALRDMLYQEISHLMHLFLNDMKGR
ncbi:MAG: TetR family transcriptional regulator, partial [Peptococcaceae bacterium]